MFFDFLGLSFDILCVVVEQGYCEFIFIQQQVIFVVLEGCDLMVSVQIGIGKIVGFMLLLL